ncbi:MAG: hypothetical protein CMM25_05465 [Rhodospirillaceae bacterium]|nr:hypothetical protein [Rhodospirillaceae bacterium]
MSSEQVILFKEQFLSFDHNWSSRTKKIYAQCLDTYIKKGMPNTNYRAMIVRCLNRLSSWCFEQGLVKEQVKLKGGNKYKVKSRVFNDDELKKILNELRPLPFQAMVRFIYYTGARQVEVRDSKQFTNYGRYIDSVTKGGRRLIRTNTQAQDVLDGNEWYYSKDQACRLMRNNMQRLGIKGTLHDLRRTFGLKMIKKIGIYETSKLLGHKTVTTTENHYAPLLAIDIEDFVL